MQNCRIAAKSGLMKVSSDYKRKNFKKERGLPRSLSFGLRKLQVACRGFTRAAVSLNLERYLLTFNETP